MRKCKLEFLIFFYFSDFETNNKKKILVWSRWKVNKTTTDKWWWQSVVHGCHSKYLSNTHWQGQVFPLPSLYFFPAPPFPTALSITSRSQISHIRCHTDIYRNPRGLKQLWGSRLSALVLSIRSTETQMPEEILHGGEENNTHIHNKNRWIKNFL